ncbi:uncharacterized protein LOC123440003 isoform X2 [Hordeum vulgare subsp. vulgare]|uniref:uncharacterized protein LOC123440003 isoform X2 n=1 Tax=Hordeum vulgare subsp. vulgare TaxID=112509 RepID=UPI001D1A486B|nr:uncharacterized protein LOC123440003 isoform X2 [Hordeum vulgare subsp. vulgare]
MARARRGEAGQARPAQGARGRAAHQGSGRRAQGPGAAAGGRVAGFRRRGGLLPATLRPLPHIRRRLPPQLRAQVFPHRLDPDVANHIPRDNSKAYPKGILAEILEFVMGTGLILADGVVWRVRRRAIVPALHQKFSYGKESCAARAMNPIHFEVLPNF